MTRQFAELTFYPGEHSGAHEKDGVLTIRVDPNSIEDKQAIGKIEDLETEVSNLEAELDEAKEEISDLESELVNRDTEIKNLENDLDTAEQFLIDKDEEIATLRDELRDLQAEMEHMMRLGMSVSALPCPDTP